MNTKIGDYMGNKEKIVELLKTNELTTKEIAQKIGIKENDTRSYLNRLVLRKQVQITKKIGNVKFYKSIVDNTSENYQKILDLINNGILVITKEQIKNKGEIVKWLESL